jgi:hypothetical protein
MGLHFFSFNYKANAYTCDYCGIYDESFVSVDCPLAPAPVEATEEIELCVGMCGRELCAELDAYYGRSTWAKAHCAKCRYKFRLE